MDASALGLGFIAGAMAAMPLADARHARRLEPRVTCAATGGDHALSPVDAFEDGTLLSECTACDRRFLVALDGVRREVTAR